MVVGNEETIKREAREIKERKKRRMYEKRKKRGRGHG